MGSVSTVTFLRLCLIFLCADLQRRHIECLAVLCREFQDDDWFLIWASNFANTMTLLSAPHSTHLGLRRLTHQQVVTPWHIDSIIEAFYTLDHAWYTKVQNSYIHIVLKQTGQICTLCIMICDRLKICVTLIVQYFTCCISKPVSSSYWFSQFLPAILEAMSWWSQLHPCMKACKFDCRSHWEYSLRFSVTCFMGI